MEQNKYTLKLKKKKKKKLVAICDQVEPRCIQHVNIGRAFMALKGIPTPDKGLASTTRNSLSSVHKHHIHSLIQ